MAAVLVAWSVVVAAACGGDASGSDAAEAQRSEWVAEIDAAAGEAPDLTRAQVIAQAMALTGERGELEFSIVLPAAEATDSTLLTGTVDYENHSGRATGGALLEEGSVLTWADGAISGPDTPVPGTDPGQQPASAAEIERAALFITALSRLSATQPDNAVLIQQNGTQILLDTSDTLSIAIEGKREAILDIDPESGTVRRAMLRLEHPSLPRGNARVVFELTAASDAP